MRIGGSLFMIAVGAILAYAVTADLSWIDIQTVGVILMVVGMVALGLSIYWMTARRRTDVVQYTTGPYAESSPPVDGSYGPGYGAPQYGNPPNGYAQRTTSYDQGYYRG